MGPPSTSRLAWMAIVFFFLSPPFFSSLSLSSEVGLSPPSSLCGGRHVPSRFRAPLLARELFGARGTNQERKKTNRAQRVDGSCFPHSFGEGRSSRHASLSEKTKSEQGSQKRIYLVCHGAFVSIGRVRDAPCVRPRGTPPLGCQVVGELKCARTQISPLLFFGFPSPLSPPFSKGVTLRPIGLYCTGAFAIQPTLRSL